MSNNFLVYNKKTNDAFFCFKYKTPVKLKIEFSKAY